jgi:signal transduction histidine kinase
LFGVELPSSGSSVEACAEIAKVRENLEGRVIDDLVDAPMMQGADNLACMQLFANLVAPVYLGMPELFPFVVSRMANLSILHGSTVDSPFGYATYSIVAWGAGDYETSYAFGRLSLELSRRFGDPAQECMTVGVVAGVVNPWQKPLRSSVALLRHAMAKGLEVGNLQFANYWSTYIAVFLFQQGVELSQVLADVDRGFVLAEKTHAPTATQFLLLLRQTVRCLQGLTPERNRLDDAEFDEAAFAAFNASDNFVTSQYEILRLKTTYLFRDVDRALKMTDALDVHAASIRANPMLAEDNFFASLTWAAALDRSPAARAYFLARIAHNQGRLGIWAASSPENFRHKHLLVAAEVARIEGRFVEAAALYDDAIVAAATARSLCDEALAKELAGRFYHRLGRSWIASLYLSLALDAFARWGAIAKVEALEEEFPGLKSVETPVWKGAVNPASVDMGGASLDLLGILKAAETISSEVMLERLLEKLIDLSLALAGAERGVLLIEEGGRMLIRAIGSIGEPVSLVPIPVETSPHVPRTLVEHVRRTAEVVVLGDAAKQGPFASDPYVADHGVKSVLALPLRRLGKLSGLLYLENNVTTNVFAPDRVRLLSLLSAQVAIALENSLLFEKLTHEIDERTHAEGALRLLADAGMLLAETLDYERTLAQVARLAVPFLAEGCMIDVKEGETLRRVAMAHIDPEKEQLLGELLHRGGSQQGARRVMATGAPLLFPEVTEKTIQEYTDPSGHALIRRLAPRTALVVPLQVGGRSLGAMSLFSSAPHRHYGPRDLALAEELARRAAVAIQNARLYNEARAAIRARDEFLSIASHELKTPITSLQLLVQGLSSGLVPPSSEVLTKTFQVAERQTRRLTTLIDGLLDVSRFAGQRFPLEFEQVDLSALVRDIAENFREQLARSKCRLSLRTDRPVVGRWDRSRLEQVVTNLLSNAIKFGAGAPIEITTDGKDGFAELVVRDHGIGIPAEQLNNIFGRFQRAVSATEYGGLGLGLYISRDIVRALGGSIRAESTLGEGSVFSVELPCAGPKAPNGSS